MQQKKIKIQINNIKYRYLTIHYDFYRKKRNSNIFVQPMNVQKILNTNKLS